MIDLASNTGRNSSDATTRAQKKLRGRSLDGPRRMKERTKKIGSSISPVRRTAKGTRTMIDTLRLSELEFLDELIVDDSPNEHEPASNEQRKAVLASLNKALSSWDDADEDFFDATRAVQKNLRGLKSSDATRGQKNQRGRSVDRMKKLVVRDSNGAPPVQKKRRSRSLGTMKSAGKIVGGAKKMLVIRDSNGAPPVVVVVQKKERSRSLDRMNIVEGGRNAASKTSPSPSGQKAPLPSKRPIAPVTSGGRKANLSPTRPQTKMSSQPRGTSPKRESAPVVQGQNHRPPPKSDKRRNAPPPPIPMGWRRQTPQKKAQPVIKIYRDPFDIFKSIMKEEYGDDYRNRGGVPGSAKINLFTKKKESSTKMFKKLDINNDKTLSRDELGNFIESHSICG